MMTLIRYFRCCAPALMALALAGCAIRGEPSKLEMPMPPAWNEAESGGQLPAAAWWRDFGSSELERLVAQALEGSPDLRIAAERIRQAEAAVSASGASLFPSLNLSGSSGRTHADPPGAPRSSSDSSRVSLGISYEIDLWGRIDAGQRAAMASLEGSRYDLETARLTLVTGVANTYFQALALRARLEIARENLALAERLLRIVDVRYRNGATSALDLSRQKTAVLTQRAALQPLEVQERQTLNALAVLIGRVPQGMQIEGGDLQALAVPHFGAGLPSELLARRPDLASAEAQLVAADANLDAARAALLPSLNLSASGGLASASLLSLADATRTLSLTAAVMQVIFDGGRLRSQVASSDSQRRASLENYRKTILTALKEVEDALSNGVRYREQEAAQLAIRDEARRSLAMSELRYREGVDDLSAVLDAQRTLFSAQDQLAQLRLSRLAAALDLVKVVGGAPMPAAGGKAAAAGATAR